MSREDSSSVVPESLCRSRSQIYKFSMTWIIYNFSFQGKRPGDVLYSAEFQAVERPDLRWRLKLYPHGESEEVSEHVSIYLSPNGDAKARYRISIIDMDGYESFSLNTHIVRTFARENGWGSKKFIRRIRLLGNAEHLLPNDCFRLYCEVEMISEVVTRDDSLECFLNTDNIAKDIGKLFNDRNLNDIVIEVNGQELVAHKAILAARSPVFDAMFRHQLKETEYNRVVVDDVEYETFKEFLQFIYTETTQSLDGGASTRALLMTADKYDVQTLKMVCEKAIASTTSVENATEILALAELYNARHLRHYVIHFVTEHICEVRNTQGWKSLTPRMLEDIIGSLAACAAPAPPAKRPRRW